MKILVDNEGTKEVAAVEAEQRRICLTDPVIHQLTALTNQSKAFFGITTFLLHKCGLRHTPKGLAYANFSKLSCRC